MNEIHLFAGAGGGILAGVLLGHRPVVAVEINPFCRDVLRQRQADGILPDFPIHDDVRTFDGTPWRGKCEIVCGGFPCTDISEIKRNAEGIDGDASGLWGEMARIVGEIRPRLVFVENSPMLVGRGLARVLGDLARMGYDARWGCLGAEHVGAPHLRKRFWLVANAQVRDGVDLPGEQGDVRGARQGCPPDAPASTWWDTEPGLHRVVDGVAGGVVKRLKACGNGQVPGVAALAWKLLESWRIR